MSWDGHTQAGVHCPILQARPAPVPVATQTRWQSGHGPGGSHASRRVGLCSALCANGPDSWGRVPMDGGPGALAGPGCSHSPPAGRQGRAEPLSCSCDGAAPRGRPPWPPWGGAVPWPWAQRCALACCRRLLPHCRQTGTCRGRGAQGGGQAQAAARSPAGEEGRVPGPPAARPPC